MPWSKATIGNNFTIGYESDYFTVGNWTTVTGPRSTLEYSKDNRQQVFRDNLTDINFLLEFQRLHTIIDNQPPNHTDTTSRSRSAIKVGCSTDVL